MDHEYFKNLNNIIKVKQKNIIFISYAPNYGGHAVRRIISASPEIFYPTNNPLKYPDHLEGFVVHQNWDIPSSFIKQHLGACHEDLIHYPPTSLDEIIKFYGYLRKQSKICLTTHDLSIQEKFDCITIRLVGKMLDRCMWARQETPEIESVQSENLINLNVNKLFSYDYEEFESEYLTLCKNIDIFPQINSVRSFILLWLEKQQRLKKILNEP